MSELIIELLSEEIPAGFQDRAAQNLRTAVEALLKQSELSFAPIETFATPRRLTLHCPDVAPRQADRPMERRGPRIDAPQAARDGFLRSLGDVDYKLGEVDSGKGTFLVATFVEPGRETAAILAGALPDLIKQFPWPKSMRWGQGSLRWVRPLQAIICVLDGTVVDFECDSIRSSGSTAGHRFMAPDPLPVRSFEEYRQSLDRAFVMLDGAERRARIEKASQTLAAEQNLRLRDDQRLLDELKGLVEWPVPLLGRIDQPFMELPEEVLVTSMREHQKYLALETPKGELAPFFITVANLDAVDGGKAIIDGNQRVLRARLWDAKFFWDQDRSQPLKSRLVALEGMVFHEKLGDLAAKAKRVGQLAAAIAHAVPGADPDDALTAGELAKADLVTGMVGEFPELQGVMGGHYARAEGLGETIASAIAEHYRFTGSQELASATSACVSLADKIDTLAGFFAVGIKPTGSKDPFALRRTAAGIGWVIRYHKLRIELTPWIKRSLEIFGFAEDAADEIVAFVRERGGQQELQRETRDRADLPFNIPSVFRAINAMGDDDLVRTDMRRSALLDLLSSEEGQGLIAAYRRAANILAIEAKRDQVDGFAAEIAQASLNHAAEIQLQRDLDALAPRVEAAIRDENFGDAIRALGRVRASMDQFFDEVMVNDPDKQTRINRLSMLNRFRNNADRIAQFSLIED